MKNDSEYHYRTGQRSDVERLRLLGLLSYGQYKNVLSPEGWQKMASSCGNAETYENLLDIARCFVCEFENKIVGMAYLIPSGNPVAFFEKEWSYIRLIGVDPEHTGKGIGRKLTQQCVDHARETGENVVVLHTSEFQSAARHIYEGMGFELYRALEPILGKKYWLYQLPLQPTKDQITFHRAGEEDLDAVIRLRIEFALELSGSKSQPEIDQLSGLLENYLKQAIKNRSCVFYLAKQGKEVAGIGGYIVREGPGNFKNPSGTWAYLMNMYTRPANRRKGICSQILIRLEQDALLAGITALELHATPEGEMVYQHHGFALHHEPTYRKFVNSNP